MTDELRRAFDDLVGGEPPLRTSAEDTVAGGRRRRGRQRALWTGLGTALAVAAVVAVPQVIRPAVGPTSPAARETSADPSPGAAASTSPSPSPTLADFLEVNPFRVCPSVAATERPTDGSRLPDPNRAADVVLAAAPFYRAGQDAHHAHRGKV